MTEFIRLLDSTGTNVLDSVSTSYEDSFGLETFGELIQEHMKADSQGAKSFIVARVQTWDHKQPDRAFYSYYNAYHLNKILFQTQIYLGKKLIHRLHVLNPLTNSDIIGNVLYFKVVYRGGVDGKGSVGTAPIGKTVIIGSAIVNEATEQSVPDHADHPRRGSQRKPSRVPDPIAEGDTGDSWTLASPAVAEATEEEGNLNAKLPFPNRKISLIPHGVSPLPNFSFTKRRTTQSSPAPVVELERQRSSSFSHSPQPPSADIPVLQVTEDDSEPKTNLRRTVSYQSKSKPAAGTITLHQLARTNVPAGTVTQFSVPVPKNLLANMAPSTPKGRRRTLSYANALAAGGRRGTMQEWANMIHDENEKDETQGPLSAPVGGGGVVENFDSVPVFGSDPHGDVRTKAFIRSDMLTPGTGTDAEKYPSTQKSPRPKVQTTKFPKADEQDLPFNSYDAIMVGTDNDFLESAKIRGLFKLNAIKPEDVVLFEMPEFTGVYSQDARPTTLIVQERVLCDLCYPTPEQLARSSRGMKIFHACKCYFAAALLLIAVFFFILFTLSPTQEKRIH